MTNEVYHPFNMTFVIVLVTIFTYTSIKAVGKFPQFISVVLKKHMK